MTRILDTLMPFYFSEPVMDSDLPNSELNKLVQYYLLSIVNKSLEITYDVKKKCREREEMDLQEVLLGLVTINTVRIEFVTHQLERITYILLHVCSTN